MYPQGKQTIYWTRSLGRIIKQKIACRAQKTLRYVQLKVMAKYHMCFFKQILWAIARDRTTHWSDPARSLIFLHICRYKPLQGRGTSIMSLWHSPGMYICTNMYLITAATFITRTLSLHASSIWSYLITDTNHICIQAQCHRAVPSPAVQGGTTSSSNEKNRRERETEICRQT